MLTHLATLIQKWLYIYIYMSTFQISNSALIPQFWAGLEILQKKVSQVATFIPVLGWCSE